MGRMKGHGIVRAGVIEETLKRRFHFNPCVAVHELRMRMRGGRPFAVLFFYALLAVLPVLITLAVVGFPYSGFYDAMTSEVGLGRVTFTALAYAQMILILFVLPAYGAGAITMEHEKRTMEMLRATLLSPADVVTGKSAVVLAFGALLLITSVPVAAWCMMLGGISPTDVLLTYSYLFVVAMWASAVGIFMSNLFTKSISAIVAAYVVLGLWCVGVPAAVSIVDAAFSYSSSTAPTGFLSFAFIVLVVGVVTGWLLFLIHRRIWSAIFKRAGRNLATLVSALVAVLLVWLVFRGLMSPVLGAVDLTSSASILLLLPYGGLIFIMYPSAAEQMFQSSGIAALTGNQIQIYAWAFSAGIFLLMALALWLRSIGLYASRSQPRT